MAMPSTLWETVLNLEESVTYQAIIQKGAVREARRIVLLLGRERFGELTPEVFAALEGLTDLPGLEQMAVRLLQASSWQELLGLKTGVQSLVDQLDEQQR
jgi:hypothetical protein